MTISKPERGAREWDTQVNLLFDRVNEFDAVDPTSLATDAEVTAAVAAHVAASDPHPGYLLTVGPASGGDDTAAIQALLTAARTAGGGLVRGTPGENYQISSALVIGSGITLDMRGCTVALLAGNQVNMVVNYANANPTATASDGAVTSGSNVVTTALAASASVGQTVTVAGAGGNGYGELIGQISAKTATTVTLVKLDGATAAAATATVSGAVVTLSDRDSNIRVVGGTWDRGNNGPTSSGTRGGAVAGHSLFFKHVDGLHVDLDRALSTSGITFVWLTSASDFDVSVRYADVVRTIVQVVGPAYRGRVPYLNGACTDDLINLCGNVYPGQTDTAGDVSEVAVGTLIGQAVGGSILKMNAGQGFTVDKVTVGQVFGTCHHAVYIGEDTAYPATTGGSYGHVDLGHVAAVPDTGYCIFLVSATAKRIKASGVSTTTNPILFSGSNTATIETLVIEDWDASGGSGGAMVNAQASGATIKHLLVDRARFDFTTNSNLISWQSGIVDQLTVRDGVGQFQNDANGYCVFVTGGTVNKIAISGGSFTYGNQIVRVNANTASEMDIRMLGFRTLDAGRLLNLQDSNLTAHVTLFDVICYSNLSAAIFTNGTTVNLSGGPVQLLQVAAAGNTTLLQRQASEVIKVYGLAIPCDLSLLTKAANELATNTNAALSCGVGPAVCDGTNWKNLASGATY